MKISYAFETDVFIAGAGPAGTSTSIFLSKYQIPHIIADKKSFPRDKTCGDALSGKVVLVLNKMNPQFVSEMEQDKKRFIDCWGVKFISPNGDSVDLPLVKKRTAEMKPQGFISKRIDFDYFLFRKLDQQFATVKTGIDVIELKEISDGIEIGFLENGEIKKGKAKVVVGADGAQSATAKQLGKMKFDDRYYSAGIRCYFENVTDLHPENFIELQFLQNITPGYLWIFPLPDNQVNVGLGIPKTYLNDKNRQLKNVMYDLIQKDPVLKERFKNARQVGEVRGWGLPLGHVKRKVSGSRFLLTGDSAQLIDPFTGEGVGNALMSGMVAAETLKSAIEKQDFSAEFLNQYDSKLFGIIGDELKLSDRIQTFAGKPWLFNFVVKRANSSPTFKDLLSDMFENVDLRAKMSSPMFYLKLLFNR